MDDVLRFQLHRLVTNLFKQQLALLEELEEDHDVALARLHDSLPPEYQAYVKLADYLDENKAKRLRGKVLDAGNDVLRQIDEQFQRYDISLRKP